MTLQKFVVTYEDNHVYSIDQLLIAIRENWPVIMIEDAYGNKIPAVHPTNGCTDCKGAIDASTRTSK